LTFNGKFTNEIYIEYLNSEDFEKIENSKQQCFRAGDVENYGIRSDDNLFEIRREKPLDDNYVLPCVKL